MEVVGVTNFRNNIKEYLEKAVDEKTDIIITRQNKKESAVLISLERYNQLIKIIENKEKI